MNPPLRILEVSPFYAPAPAYGGAPVVAREFSEALAARGHEVRVLTTDAYTRDERHPSSEDAGPVEVTRFRNLSNTAAHDLQLYTPGRIPLLLRMRWACRWADIVHIHTHRNKLEIAAARAARKSNTPYVLHGHGTVPAIERRFFIKKLYDRLWGDAALEGASGFIAVSDAEVEQYRKKGIPETKIWVMPNGLHTEKFSPLPEPGLFRRAYDIPLKAPLILYAGKITPRQPLEVLVEAVSKLKNKETHLAVVGADMGHLREVKRRVQSTGLQNRTVLTGVLTFDKLLRAYVDADVCAYPSTLEIFGLVPFEALLCGTPVVVSNDSGCGEMIEKARAGLCVPYGHARTLAQAIEDLLTRPEESRQFVVNGRAFVRDSLAWPRLAESAEVFFRQTIERHGQTV